MWVKRWEQWQVSGQGVKFITSEGGYRGAGELCNYMELLKGIFFFFPHAAPFRCTDTSH